MSILSLNGTLYRYLIVSLTNKDTFDIIFIRDSSVKSLPDRDTLNWKIDIAHVDLPVFGKNKE